MPRPKIEKRFFSTTFKRLPLKKKVAVRRELEKNSKNLAEKTQKLVDQFQEFHTNMKNFSFIKAEEKLRDFGHRHYRLSQDIAKLEAKAKPYFVGFDPHSHWGPSQNPIDIRLHKALRDLNLFKHYQPLAQAELRKRRM